jgi:hypothetical protein
MAEIDFTPETTPQVAHADSAQPEEPDLHAKNRIRDLARVENENAADAAQRDADNAMRTEVVGKAVPERYLRIVEEIREAVRVFNSSLQDPEGRSIPRITWFETPNVALKDPYAGDGMRVRISRRNATFDFLLVFASRSGKGDVPLMEGYGDYGKEHTGRVRTMMRVEGWVEKGQPVFWYSLDLKRQKHISIEEVAERIVASVAANDYSLLSRDLKGRLVSEVSPVVAVTPSSEKPS